MSFEFKENFFFMEVVENELDNILISVIWYFYCEILGVYDFNFK